jgi:hypothetical protein
MSMRTITDPQTCDAIFSRLPGKIQAEKDLVADEVYLMQGKATDRWIFVRFHRDGSAAVVRMEPS